MTETNDLTRKVKDIRERAGLSVRAMAQRVGMSSSGYLHYESPNRFKDDYLPMAVARQIARALEGTPVDPMEVLELAGGSAPLMPQNRVAAGFAEAATPFEFQEYDTKPDDPQRTWRALFGNRAATPASFRLLGDHHGFGLSSGDILICDLARVPRPGELALVSIIDEEGASSLTRLCRYLPPYLTSSDFSEAPLRIDQPGVTVRCPVIGSVRGLTD